MYSFLRDADFLWKKENNSHHYFGNVMPSQVTWEDAFNIIEHNIDVGGHQRRFPYYGFALDVGADIIIPCISNFKKEIKQLFKYNNVSAHTYIALSKRMPSFGDHSDASDVFFWQAIGKTRWIVTERHQQYNYVMSPGDIIYVPKNMYHHAISLGPRVGFSIGSP